MATLPNAAPHGPYAAFKESGFRLFLFGRVIGVNGGQMMGVAAAWEIYQLTHSAMALGIVGLVQVVPVILFALPAGHMADQYNRKRIILAVLTLAMLTSLAMAGVSYYQDRIPNSGVIEAANRGLAALAQFFERSGERTWHFDSPAVPPLLFLLFMLGLARSLGDPARQSLIPLIVRPEVFPNAITWSTSAFHMASMTGPALGGILLGVFDRPALIYLINAGCILVAILTLLPIRPRAQKRVAETFTLASLLTGVRWVYKTKLIFATLNLDLFAVLFGGAVALLPIFADRLGVGAVGLGWLRAAMPIGAFVMGLWLAHSPPVRNAGRNMLWSVAGFGVATVVFAVSDRFWLSMLMLLVAGALDNISVVIRHTLVQILTPDEMRGRVSAVNSIFISASNEMGALESGLTAALLGAVGSVVLGGFGTLAVVGASTLIWPELRRLKSLYGGDLESRR